MQSLPLAGQLRQDVRQLLRLARLYVPFLFLKLSLACLLLSLERGQLLLALPDFSRELQGSVTLRLQPFLLLVDLCFSLERRAMVIAGGFKSGLVPLELLKLNGFELVDLANRALHCVRLVFKLTCQ